LCKGGGFPCYAYRLAHGRLKERYLANKNHAPTQVPGDGIWQVDPFYPRFWPNRLNPLSKASAYMNLKPKGIFVCDMSDLFGIGIPEDWTRQVLEHIKWCSQHRFYLLTKQPQNLQKFSPFPANCWVGVTMTKPDPLALEYLDEVEAKIRYLSLEPMLARWPEISFEEIPADWLIIGACTGSHSDLVALQQRYPELALMPYGKKWTLQPRIEWVQEIVQAADKAGVAVFLKDNLKPLIDDNYPDRNRLVPNHDRLVRSPHPILCRQCKGDACSDCGVVWSLRREFPQP